MNRIRKAFEARFRVLLGRAHARRMEQGVTWLWERATRQSERGQIPLTHALLATEQHLEQRLAGMLQRQTDPPPNQSAAPQPSRPVQFCCDAGLGGLARWLRAAGYETWWKPDIDDAELVRESQQSGAILLTTDSLLLDRRLLRDGLVASLWLPPTLKIPEQLCLVLEEFRLETLEPRCMNCGGELRSVDKQTVWERIPPKTRLWLDEYFLCARCGQLFWHGTHWQRIQRALAGCRSAAGVFPGEAWHFQS